MTAEKKLKFFKVIKIVLLIMYIPLLLIYLGLFVPEYLACVNINEDGAIGKSIWGNEVECFGESRGLGDGLFIFFSEIIGVLTIVVAAIFLILNHFRNRLL